jgi:N-acetylmuramoyl-L-alanine amidase
MRKGVSPTAVHPTRIQKGHAMPFKPDAIVMHHSWSPDHDTLDWESIRRFHTSWRCDGNIVAPEAVNDLMAQGAPVVSPWDDIGYHYGIERLNGHYEILTGRLPTVQGAHCVTNGMNRRSLGVCLVGNFDKEPVPDVQWNLAAHLVRSLMQVHGIPPFMVYGHREIAPDRTCPGHLFDLNRFRKALSL